MTPRAGIAVVGLCCVVVAAVWAGRAGWGDLADSIVDGCGFLHRDAVRSATDPAAATIAREPRDTTVAALNAAAPPASFWPWAPRAGPVETRVWRLTARITAVAGPTGDGDYHLRLLDEAGRHMVAEAVAPGCAAGSPFLPQIAAVRAKVAGGLPLNTPLTFTGIGFVDNEHGVIGAAPSGVELHPLLDIAPAGGVNDR